jgi:cell division protein FtsZ
MAVLDPKIDGLKYELEEDAPQRARIKVLGVGGGGSNAVAHMMNGGLEGVDFYVLNTDSQALAASPVPKKLAIGAKVTRGRGAGADPSVGRQAALEDTERIVEILEGADMVFVTAGMGSGTGTGAAPVVASLARELGALTVAVVTKPFGFEGDRRGKQAEKGMTELAASVDTVIAIPNDRLLTLAPRGTSILEAFRLGHDLLRQTVQDIVEIITTPGMVNRDFSDIRATMFGMGCAMMGTATARGENAAVEAARQAISCPLLEDAGIKGARNILINITGSSRLGLHEVNDACALIRQAAECEEVQLNFGIVLNESMADAVKMTVIATGFPRREAPAVNGQESFAQAAWPAPAEPEPEPLEAQAEAPAPPVLTPQFGEDDDVDDLDTPAFLRQRRTVQ